MSGYTVKVVEQDGTVIVSSLSNCNVGPIEYALNEPTRCTVGFPKGTASASSILPLDRELQVFRTGDTNPRFWGPMVSVNAEGTVGEVQVACVDPAWYFTRRQISDARPNLLSNPQFELDLAGWTNSGTSTDTASTTRKVLGTKSLKLVQASAGVDTHEYQQVSVTGTAIGTYLTVAAWVYIDNTAWVGPAYESRGLFVQGTEGATVRDYRFVELDDATPRGRWERLETGIWIPPSETWTIEVRLYAPGGDVWWDAVQLVAMNSLSHYATDMGTIAGNIIDFIQNPTHGWNDLNIVTSDATTSVLLDRHYQYADHTDVMQALGEFEDMGLDWSVEVTPTVRTFTTYYPKGTDRTATVTLSMRSAANPTGNLSDYRLTVDGAATSTRITVLGEGDGPDREEGYAANAILLGGLVLGDVISARPNSPIDALDGIAQDRLSDSLNLVQIVEVTGLPGDTTTLTTLVIGDKVTLNISDGWVNLGGQWRIVKKTIDPATDTASFVLNEVAAGDAYEYEGGDAPESVTQDDIWDGGAADTVFVSSVDGGSA